ncbi:MAG: hypothetical protein R6V77_03640 [Candidatus Cloacimonadaceae bacterium]
MKYLFPLILLALLTAGCMSKYYEQFGGFPMDTKEFTFQDETADLKLQVTYRYPYQAAEWDTTSLNLTIKIIINKKDVQKMYINRLVLASIDNTYLYSYPNPAVYDAYGKYPIRLEFTDPATGAILMSSDQPSIFTISRTSPEYEISLSYKVKAADGGWQDTVKTALLDISELKVKVGLDNPEFLQSR